ncbi:caspase family protein [Candidatus Uabimicrobium amorphum]|uniref:Peptidase C14 n=1 Tax=Uabimicrobium amorphum TaxID=2596890 RepID=A0A5S9IRE6_UABAM|nr:caspase family protein [Candidatus Uabimicrobium amorphum]BBM86236.1 peptidase C14 [Candidatus Uabimicrobium amorphum]
MYKIAIFLVLFIYPLLAQNSKTKALLIGINKYENLPKKYWLDGCENDVSIVKNMLKTHFSVDNITTLINEEATRETILKELDKLSQYAKKPSTQIIIFFSGHGSLKKDGPDGDEADGFDETILTYNSTLQGEGDIIDDEIHQVLQNLTALKAHVTMIFDCCHSGSGNRGSTKMRNLERPFSLLSQTAKMEVEKHEAIPGMVFLSACHSYEKEPEYVDKISGKTFGLLTFHLVKAIEEAKQQTITYQWLFEKIHSYYAQIPWTPSPTLSGNKQKIVFAKQLQILPKMAKVTKVQQRKKRVFLNRGSLHNFSKGSIFCLLPPDEVLKIGTNLPKKYLLVKLIDCSPFSSIAKVIRNKGDITHHFPREMHPLLSNNTHIRHVTKNWKALELLHNYGDLRLQLFIEHEFYNEELHRKAISFEYFTAHHPLLSATLKQLEEVNAVKMVSKLQKADAILRVGKKKAAVVWAQGDNILDSSPISKNHEPKGFGPVLLNNSKQSCLKLEDILLHMGKAYNLITLNPIEEWNGFTVDLVDLEEIDESDDIDEIVAIDDEMPSFEDLRQIGFLFHNNTDSDVYPHVIYIDSSLQIQVLYPPKSVPDDVEISVGPGQKRILSGLELESLDENGRETLKIIVSSIHQDFSELELHSLSKSRAQKISETEQTVIGNLLFQSVFSKKRSTFGAFCKRARLLKQPPRWTVLTKRWITTGE